MCEDLFHAMVAYSLLKSFFLSLCLDRTSSVQQMPERRTAKTERKIRTRSIMRERATPKILARATEVLTRGNK